ncbi:vomeronasal type-2 receptor 116-like [Sigmodon hispidus]
MAMDEEGYNIYKAVYAVAQSLYELSLQQVQLQPNVNGKTMDFFPWQLHHFVRKINVEHNMNFNWKQESDAEYDIINFWNFPKGLGLKIPHSVCSESCGPGFRKAALEGKAVCSYDCTPCPDNEISNETDMGQCVTCPENYFANTEKNYCLQKAISF